MPSHLPDADELLVRHLRGWLGAWPPIDALDVVGADLRRRPGWDGAAHELVGVGTPERTLLSVPPDRVDAVTAVSGPLEDPSVRRRIVDAVGAGDKVLGRGVFRWSTNVASVDELPDAGEWVDPADPRVPAWLRPFNHPRVLVAWSDDGAYGAGVGIKRHDEVGHELAVVTTPALQGRGIGRRLVAQAARAVLAAGGLPTYLHDRRNAASAHVADAVGFPDHGWSVYGLFGG
jgi:GNAT superfamily N-acetyltransferase